MRRTAVRAAYNIARRAVGLRIVDCWRLDREGARAAPPIPGFEVRWLTPEEVLARAADPGLRLDWPWRSLALARGDACLGLFDGDRLVSFGWHAVAPTPILGDRLLHFPPDRVYCYHTFTLPEYRGRRLLAASGAFALGHYAAHGYRGLMTFIERTNYAARRSMRAMGFVPCGSLYRVVLARRAFAWVSDRCAAEGIALENAA